MVEDIKKTWAKAQSLSAYFASLVLANPIDEVAIAKKYQSDYISEDMSTSTLESLAKSAQSLAISSELSEQRKKQRKKLIEYIRNKMVESELKALGRTAIAGGLDTIVALTDDHWIGAEINPEDNIVVVGRQSIDMVRVVIPNKSLAKSKGRRGPSPKSELRRSVISACVKDDSDLLNKSPSVRVRNYKRYIEKYHKDVDLRRGFSPSAFQEDELYLRDNSMI